MTCRWDLGAASTIPKMREEGLSGVADAERLTEADTGFARDYWREPLIAPTAIPADDVDKMDPLQFELLADNLPTLCWIAKGDGYIFWYNRRWHEYCGSTPEAMEGWGWQSVHDPAELPRVVASWTASIATGRPFEMVFPLRGADGAYRPFLTRASPLRDASGEIVRWFGVNVEITAQVHAEAALDASEAKYNVLTEAMPQMVWSTLPDGYHDYHNAQWYEFTGMPFGSTDGMTWNGMFHPDDQARAWTRWRHSLATGEPYEIEYRLRHRSGAYRWTLGRALPVRDEKGQITRWIGTCTDIDESKIVAERNETLTRELSHRIKNIFAIITGLIRLSVRRDPSAKAFAGDLLARVAALDRAHEFARPHGDDLKRTTSDMTLKVMLRELFLPYSQADESRVVITGDDVPIDDRGATPVCLLFHELATNAAKYGSLSTPEGRVDVEATRQGGTITLVWRETGGPPVPCEPTRVGFGTQLATMSVDQQLGGKLTRRWLAEGLEATVVLQASRLSRI